MKATSYEADVQCVPHPEYDGKAACSNVLGTMPVSRNSLIFTENTRITADKTLVPRGGKHYKSATYVLGECTATVDFETGDTDRSSDFEMWAAAVAVNTICVANGKAGAAFGLGESILSHMCRGKDVDVLRYCRPR